MLSSVKPPVNKVAVGPHPYIRLLKCVFNSRLRKVKLVPEMGFTKSTAKDTKFTI